MSFPSNIKSIINQKYPVIKLSRKVCRDFSLTGVFPRKSAVKKCNEEASSSASAGKMVQRMGLIRDSDITGEKCQYLKTILQKISI